MALALLIVANIHMKNWNVIAKIMMAGACALALNAHADADYPALNGIDLKPAVKFFKKYVHVTNHSGYMWNWFNAQGHSDLWKDAFPSDDGMGLMHVQNAIPLFWNSYCSGDASKDPADCPRNKTSPEYGGGNSYGPGFYLAVDPAITQGFGVNKGSNWVLLQVKLPVGLRMIDIAEDYNLEIPKAVQDVFAKLDCPELGTYNVLDQSMTYSSNNFPNAKCKLGIRKIFKDILKIDGFVYRYQAVGYTECQHADTHLVATVLTSDRMFKNGDHRGEVLAFTNKTTDHVEDRVRIESLFLYAAQMNADNLSDKILRYNISRTGFPGHPGKEFYNLDRGGNGKYTAALCPSNLDQNCEGADVPESLLQAFPTTLSGKYPAPGYEGDDPMWPDLDGQVTTPDLSNWIQKNFFHCAQPSDYQ